MSWRRKRQLLILGMAMIAFLLIFGWPVYKKINPTASCFDGRQNQNERGIDCGGECEAVCGAETSLPAVLWARSFEVVPGVYNSVALIDNPNRRIFAEDVSYRFRLFDSENILVTEREGKVDILPGRTHPVFEASLRTGERRVQRTFFELDEKIEWRRLEDNLPNLAIEKRELESSLENPRLSATVSNRDERDSKNITFIAIVFDAEGNAVSSSKTKLERIREGESKEIVFTWPEKFKEAPVRTEVYSLFDI